MADTTGLENLVFTCTAVDLLSAIDTESVGAVITDPPEIVSNVRSTIKHVGRVLRPGGGMIMIGSTESLAVWERLATRAGLTRMAEVILLWDSGKPRTRNFGSIHSRIVWWVKSGWRHTFNFDLGPRQEIFSNVLVAKRVPVGERVHPSEKPVGVTNFLVSLLSNPGDLIVDPYCGSGSTLVSAVQCDRRYLGSDVDEWNVKVSQKRVIQADLESPEPVYLWINGIQHEV